MKKLFLLVLVVLSTVTFAESDFYINPKIGVDIISGYERTYDDNGNTLLNSKTKGFGGEVAVEGYKILNEHIDVGLGLAYQVHAGRKHFNYKSKVDTSGVRYRSIPVYVTGRYNFISNSQVKPYLKANLGYSFNFDASDLKSKNTLNDRIEKTSIKVNSGLYWGVGAGIEYKNYTIELMYAINKCKVSGSRERVDYDRITLSVGYKFNF
ncbi:MULTISPECIES: outer membrane beta-barrel protein [Psychrilyobacter]|nr:MULTISPECIES: outer membrane beta-barrel protein [Psychrilyobacter]MCS5422112.1 porin family protein [Psychrilyobacter sp. S5]NDI78400.1 porin family protein [Psychrilyobacter piezotolerans]